jgi:hypothetical protein
VRSPSSRKATRHFRVINSKPVESCAVMGDGQTTLHRGAHSIPLCPCGSPHSFVGIVTVVATGRPSAEWFDTAFTSSTRAPSRVPALHQTVRHPPTSHSLGPLYRRSLSTASVITGTQRWQSCILPDAGLRTMTRVDNIKTFANEQLLSSSDPRSAGRLPYPPTAFPQPPRGGIFIFSCGSREVSVESRQGR